MALFTNKADASLPALTQFYQLWIGSRDEGETDLAYGRRLLNTPAGEELRFWVSRILGTEGTDQAKEMPVALLTLDSSLGSWGATSEQSNFDVPTFPMKSNEELLVWLAGLQVFLVHLMNCVATRKVPSPDEVDRLNELLAKYAPPRIFWYVGSNLPGDRPEIRIEEGETGRVRALLIGTVDGVEQLIGRLLLGQFHQALTRRQFDRCPLCDSVFLRENPKAVVCSRRCSSRQSQRKWKRRKAKGNE